MQNQERDLLRQMYDLQIELPVPPTTTTTLYTNTELKQPADINTTKKNHFEDLQRKNLRLERERRGKYLVKK